MTWHTGTWQCTLSVNSVTIVSRGVRSVMSVRSVRRCGDPREKGMWWLGAGEERRREPVPCEGLGHGGQPVLAAA